jgi:hypothetical protein
MVAVKLTVKRKGDHLKRQMRVRESTEGSFPENILSCYSSSRQEDIPFTKAEHCFV